MFIHVSPRTPSSSQSDVGSQKLVLVQALRVLAALIVIFVHAQVDAAHFAGPEGFTPNRALPWEVGVDIFFVISGFIIVHASRKLFGQPESRRIFLAHRLIRILPLYWVATLAFLSVALVMPQALNSLPPTVSEIVASFLFFPLTNSQGLAQPVLSLGWTLNYEMAFYLVFMLAVALPRERAVLVVALFFSLLVGLGTVFFLPMPLSFWADPMAMEFVFGMGIALARDTKGRPGIILRAVLVYVAIYMLRENLLADGVARVFALGVPAVMLVMAAVLGPEPRLPPLLGRAIVLLGDASYALYLFHPMVLRATRLFFAGTEIGPWTYVIIAMSIAVAMSVVVHLAFERPLTRYLRRAWERGAFSWSRKPRSI